MDAGEPMALSSLDVQYGAQGKRQGRGASALGDPGKVPFSPRLARVAGKSERWPSLSLRTSFTCQALS